MDTTQVTKDIENKTLIIERTFDAPKEKLWSAYTDKEQFEQWWGPEGWETTVKEFDFVPGGRVHYCMKCVDERQEQFFGQEAWGIMILETIDELNSFSAMDYFSNVEGTIDPQMPAQKFTVEFIEDESSTRLVNKSVAETTEELEKVLKMGMVEGFSSQLNKLEKLIAE